MNRTIGSSEIRWLTDPGTEFADSGPVAACRQIDVPLPEGIGCSSIRSIHLPLNVFVYAGTHRFTPPVTGKLIPYARHTASFNEPVLLIHDLKTGEAAWAEDDGVPTPYGATSGTLFHHAVEIDRSVLLDLGEQIDFTAVGLGDSVLRELMGEETARNMLETMGVAEVPSSCVAKIPRRVTAVLHACMPAHLTGTIGILYTQAKILEFFCELAGWLDSIGEQPEQREPDRGLILELHEELSGLEGRVPTLDELSRKYGKSGRALNQGFRELFGSSIFTFVSDRRLAQAHEALASTDVPMKAIAMNLGYSHVNNFINAFRKKYGYPPGSLRK